MDEKDIKITKSDKDFASIQAELDAERERLLEERRAFEAEKREREKLAEEAKRAAGIVEPEVESQRPIVSAAESEAALKTQLAAEAAREAAEKAKKAADKVGRKSSVGGFIRGLIVGLIAATVACFFLGKAYIDKNFGTHTIEPLDDDNVIEEHLTGYTAADFQDAILGEAQGRSELIVMEEPMQLTTTIHREGPWEWEVFRRTKNVTFYGTGVYTVDLSKMNASAIKVDEENKTVTVTVPKAVLQYVNPDYEKIEFEDTDMGIFAFKDITMTVEEQTALENSVVKEMRESLSSTDLMDAANDFAKMKVWEIFQPLVTAVSPEFKLEVKLQ